MSLFVIISKLIVNSKKLYRKVLIFFVRGAFLKVGKNFIFDPFGYYTFNTITVGDDVFINHGAYLSAPNSSITIGDKVLIGPNVTMLGGDHRFSTIGIYMYDDNEKKTGDDLPIVIENDVWIGAGVIVLKGVTIGRGSIIAAGTLVNKSVLPYSIVAGVPGKTIKKRFCDEDIVKHEKILLGEADH